MRIKSISIRNYRQYKKLDFSFNKVSGLKNDLHVIIAQNGIGKSNFLNSITWCLYEEESHLQDNDKNKGLPIVNIDTIAETEEKGHINVVVKLVIDVDGEDETIIRQMSYIKNSLVTGKIKWIETKFYVAKKTIDPKTGIKALGTIQGDDAKNYISRLFPKEISQYFFFDNEQMNNYFKSHSGRSIEKSINDITKVSLVQVVNDRLKNLESEYKVKLSDGNDVVDKLRIKLDSKEAQLKSEKEELEQIEEQIDAGKERISVIDADIRGAENLKALERSRELLESSINELKETKKDNEDELRRFIVRYTTLLNLYPAFESTLKLIDDKEKDRQLPPDISVDILKRTVSSGVCELCGNELDHIHLSSVIEKLNRFNVSNPVYELLLSIKHKTMDLKQEAEKYEIEKERILGKQHNIESKLEDLRLQLNETIASMKSIENKEDILKKIDERESLRNKLDTLISNRGSIKTIIAQLQKEYQNALEEFERAINTENRNKDKYYKYKKTKELRDYLTKTEEEIVGEIRKQISEKTYRNFVSLIWKSNTYKSVEITQNYTVDLIHKDGYSAIGSTSAAERALLALSFTNAMHEVSGFESPLVIDSPVGRVSDINRRKFAESLAEISRNKQIIMLFTPDEYSKDVSDVFDSIAVISRASMNESETITTIKGE